MLLLVESRKKSRFVAILLNIFLPGAGYMYCGRWILGVVAFFFVVALIVVSFGLAAIGLYIALIVDAALCVGRYNRRMTEELLRSRAQLKREANGSFVGGALLIVLGIATTGLLAEKVEADPIDQSIQTPECGSEEATELIVSQLNYEVESGLAMLGYGAAAASMRIFEVVDAEELFFDAASGFRACLAKSRHKKGYGITGYTIEWANRSAGYFRAMVVDPGVLAATYGEEGESSE